MAANAAARAQDRSRTVCLLGNRAIVAATNIAVIAPSGRKSAATQAIAIKERSPFAVRASCFSLHSHASLVARAIAHANGITSMPLDEHHAKPAKASTIAA